MTDKQQKNFEKFLTNPAIVKDEDKTTEGYFMKMSIPKYHHRVMVFDTETTGLMPRHKPGTHFPPMEAYPHIMQFSWIVYNILENKIEEVVDEYVQIPKTVPISPESIQVHGITREIADEKGKPITTLLAKFFVAYMKCDCIVAHNLQFDSEMVRKEMWRNRVELEMKLANKDRVNMMCGIFTKKFNAVYHIDTFCTMMNTIQFCGIEFAAKPKIPGLRSIPDSKREEYELTPENFVRMSSVEFAESKREECEQTPVVYDTSLIDTSLIDTSLNPMLSEVVLLTFDDKSSPVNPRTPTASHPAFFAVTEPKASRKKFPKLNELYSKLFDTPLPMDMHNSIVDVLVCLRCFLKVRSAKEMEEHEFLELIKIHSRG
jgi:DNA polymerase III epsilon subunit-like protein